MAICEDLPIGVGPPEGVIVIIILSPADIEVMEVLCAGVVAGPRLLHLLRHAFHRQADCVALEGGTAREECNAGGREIA